MKFFYIFMTLFLTGLLLQTNKSIADEEDVMIWASPELARLIKEGLAKNRELQSLKFKVESLREEISVAGALNDPRIGIGLLNVPTDSFSFSQEPMTQKQLFISQKIPWFGKLDLKSQKAALMAEREEAMLFKRKLSLARQIADSYYQLGSVNKAQNINRRLIEMVKQLIKVSETHYASGKGLQQDVLQAQVELTRLIDEKLALNAKRRTMQDRINELLNREVFSNVQPPEKLADPELKIDVTALKNIALNQNPGLAVKKAEVDMAVIGIDLAEKDFWPDVDFKIAYGQRTENDAGRDLPDFVSASAAMNIPLWHKSRQSKKLAASRSLRESASKAYQDLTIRLPHLVDALTSEILSLQESYTLYRDVLKFQAEQLARSSMAAYQVGKVEFNTMINAQIRLLRIELKTEKYLFNIFRKRAELEEVVGGPLK